MSLLKLSISASVILCALAINAQVSYPWMRYLKQKPSLVGTGAAAVVRRSKRSHRARKSIRKRPILCKPGRCRHLSRNKACHSLYRLIGGNRGHETKTGERHCMKEIEHCF